MLALIICYFQVNQFLKVTEIVDISTFSTWITYCNSPGTLTFVQCGMSVNIKGLPVDMRWNFKILV